MLIRKEIRIVALMLYLPEGVDAHEYLEGIAERRESCVVSYDKTCVKDKTCLQGKVKNTKLGVVAWEDKKYVIPLIEKSPTHSIEMQFKELYWNEEWTPILRYVIYVDLNDVKKDLPGEYWAGWEYHGLSRLMVDEWNSLYDTIDYMRGVLIGSLPADDNLDDVIKEIALKSHYDISIDATTAIENICFLLEMNHDERSDKWKNKLQRASTARRSKKTIMRFAEKWWPTFLESGASRSLLHTYLMRLKAKYKIKEGDNCVREFCIERDIIEEDLQSLPYNLYDYIEDPPMMFYVAFYKMIPFEKMVDLFSAVLMRLWMKNLLESKVNTLGSLIIAGSVNTEEIKILGNIVNNGGTLTGDINIK